MRSSEFGSNAIVESGSPLARHQVREGYLKVQSVQSVAFDKWAAVVIGAVGIMLLGSAAFISTQPAVPLDFDKIKELAKVAHLEALTFDEFQSLVTEPIRAQLSTIFALIGVGLVSIGVALCCLNEIAHDLFFKIGYRVSSGLSGPGLVLIAFVIIFALVAIPISYRPTSQFFLDLAKVGFGAFLAVFVQGRTNGHQSDDGSLQGQTNSHQNDDVSTT
jgi:hypothetical protein